MDLISRQAAIDIVKFECGEWKGLAKEIVKQFNGMPAVDLSDYCDKLWKTAYERGKAEAHPKKGKWKEVQVVIGRDGDFTTKEYECQICGYRQYFPENYCGRCGTRMEE